MLSSYECGVHHEQLCKDDCNSNSKNNRHALDVSYVPKEAWFGMSPSQTAANECNGSHGKQYYTVK